MSPRRLEAAELPCANCGGELPDDATPARAYVPRRGRELPVCDPCKSFLDAAIPLALPPPSMLEPDEAA